MMPAPTRIRVDEKDGVRVVRFVDRLLFDDRTVREAADQLHSILAQVRAGEAIILDFSGVENISSSMVGKLVLMQRRIDALHARLRFCEINEIVSSVFHTTNLDRVFSIDHHLRESLSAVGKGDGG